MPGMLKTDIWNLLTVHINEVCLLSVSTYGHPYTYVWNSPLNHDVTPPSTDFAIWCKNSIIQHTLTTIEWNLLIVYMTQVHLGSVPAYGYPYTYVWKSPLNHDATPPSQDFTIWSKCLTIQHTFIMVIWNLLIVHMTYVCLGSVPAYGYPYTYVWKSPWWHDMTPPSQDYTIWSKCLTIQHTFIV